jgi:hypothetical protein
MGSRQQQLDYDYIPLYPDEKTIARAVLGPKRVKEWRAKAAQLERDGLPKIDALMGGRYWPAVQLFFDIYNGLEGRRQKNGPIPGGGRLHVIHSAPDGPENSDAERAAAKARKMRRKAAVIVERDRRSSRK